MADRRDGQADDGRTNSADEADGLTVKQRRAEL